MNLRPKFIGISPSLVREHRVNRNATENLSSTNAMAVQRERDASEKSRNHANQHRELVQRERKTIVKLPQCHRELAQAMRLVPTQPPGRGTRKARDFGSEIVELRAQGYTLEAIRVALANAGVHVTVSTVWRETKRAPMPVARNPVAKANAASPPLPDADVKTAVSSSTSPTAAPPPIQRRKGMEIAEDFMRSQITNPLIRAKDPR